MTPEHRDHDLGAALRELPVPDYDPGFHADLSALLDANPPPLADTDVARVPWRRSTRRAWWPAPAAGFALVVVLLAIVIATNTDIIGGSRDDRGRQAYVPSPRPRCGEFCRRAGGVGGVGSIPPAKIHISSQAAPVRNGFASIKVRCYARTACVGAIVLFAIGNQADIDEFTHFSPAEHFNRTDLKALPDEPVTIDVPLSPGARRLLASDHQLRVSALVELLGKPFQVVSHDITLRPRPHQGS